MTANDLIALLISSGTGEAKIERFRANLGNAAGKDAADVLAAIEAAQFEQPPPKGLSESEAIAARMVAKLTGKTEAEALAAIGVKAPPLIKVRDYAHTLAKAQLLASGRLVKVQRNLFDIAGNMIRDSHGHPKMVDVWAESEIPAEPVGAPEPAKRGPGRPRKEETAKLETANA